MPRGKPNYTRSLLLLSSIAVLLALLLLVLPDREKPRKAIEEIPEVETEGSVKDERPVAEEAVKLRAGRISLVIDDVGYNLRELQPFLDLPSKITFAVLPHLTYSETAAQMIFEAGKEVILHLPMEPVSSADPGPGAILTAHSDEEVREALEKSFASVPHAIGVNNHMGSKAMEDIRIVEILMSYLERENKFFLDSRTTAASVAQDFAEDFRVPFLERSLFLDYDTDEKSIRDAYSEGLALAEKGEAPILIGHVHSPGVLKILKELPPELDERGLVLAFLSELVPEKVP